MYTVSIQNEIKINKILQSWPSGTVGLAVWLEENGISRQLQQRYLKSGWLERIGRGAFQRAGDSVDWLGGLYALQKQAKINIHVGGRTALGMQSQAHYLEREMQTVSLFAPLKVGLPSWFNHYDWKIEPKLHLTNFLPANIGFVDVESKLFTVRASGSVRALMECLYLAPKEFDLVEAYQIMEGLGSLRPVIVQQLLEECRSVKVKRLFVFLSEKSGHAWFKYIDLTKIDMGQGKRSLAEGGTYIAKYQITVPKELLSV